MKFGSVSRVHQWECGDASLRPRVAETHADLDAVLGEEPTNGVIAVAGRVEEDGHIARVAAAGRGGRRAGVQVGR